MVESASITAMIIDIIICVAMPLGCLVYLLYNRRKPFIPALVGLAVFIVFQLISRVTVMGLIVSAEWYQNMIKNPWLLGLFAGVSMGLFTEVGRYAGYKLLLKERRSFSDGLSMGIGYAGFEAIFIGALNYIGSLSFANMINSGQTDQIAAMSSPEMANEAIRNLTTVMPIDIYLGGLDRIFMFIIHIALSVLVLLGIRKFKLAYLGIAVLAHLIIDGVPEAFVFSNVTIVIYLGVLAALSVVYILRTRKQFEPEPKEE